MIMNEVVSQAIDYILQHIEEEITIEDVAAYCHFSKYYFSRMFKLETGESLYAFIKRIRIEQSAFKLKVERDRSITEIGCEYGYTPSNYSSVFRQHRNSSPADFRKGIIDNSLKHPFFQICSHPILTLEECKQHITIETYPDIKVIYERMKGSYHYMGITWCEFVQKYKQYFTDDTIMIERTYDDPSITDQDNCLYDLCLSVSNDCTLENTTIISGGKFAVYHFEGAAVDIYCAYQSIFLVWFPQSHYRIDERYGYDIYRNINEETGIFLMDLCIPIK